MVGRKGWAKQAVIPVPLVDTKDKLGRPWGSCRLLLWALKAKVKATPPPSSSLLTDFTEGKASSREGRLQRPKLTRHILRGGKSFSPHPKDPPVSCENVQCVIVNLIMGCLVISHKLSDTMSHIQFTHISSTPQQWHENSRSLIIL